MAMRIDEKSSASLSETARRWTLALTAQASVTGSAGEALFGPWLAGELERSPDFGRRAEVRTFPVAPGDARHCVTMLVRGTGSRTVILTGHFDTVSFEDYGSLRNLATEPEHLAAALREALAARAETPAARRARADLAGTDFLPGRGLLDMKAGLAAGLAAAAAFARGTGPGNVLFLAVPDEENNSAGARAAAGMLPLFAREHGLDLEAAINLDAIADDGEGRQGRVIALGTVGKLLPTAFVAGIPAHGGFPLNGVNAGALAAAIAARVEWAAELADDAGAGPGTPPSLLSLRDGKAGYDVTTPATAFATFNVLSTRMTPAAVLDAFDRLCADAAAKHLADLRARVPAGLAAGLPDTVPVLRFEALAAAAAGADPGNPALIDRQAEALARADLTLPEKCRLLTEELWRLSSMAGPAIVSGFGSIPYLPASLSDEPAARRLGQAARDVAAASAARYGTAIATTPYFAGISDVSFLGEADEGSLDVVARNTPLWRQGVCWPDENGIANLPTVNAGPWGRDYHTPLERLHAPYAFDVLPQVLVDIVEAVLSERPDSEI